MVIEGSGFEQNIYINANVQIIEPDNPSSDTTIELKLIGEIRPNIHNYVKINSNEIGKDTCGIVTEEWMSCNSKNIQEKCPENEAENKADTEEEKDKKKTFRVYKVILASSASQF